MGPAIHWLQRSPKHGTGWPVVSQWPSLVLCPVKASPPVLWLFFFSPGLTANGSVCFRLPQHDINAGIPPPPILVRRRCFHHPQGPADPHASTPVAQITILLPLRDRLFSSDCFVSPVATRAPLGDHRSLGTVFFLSTVVSADATTNIAPVQRRKGVGHFLFLP